MKRYLIFDLGNVLARFDHIELTAACVRDPLKREAIRHAVFYRPYWDRLDDGTLTDEAFKQEIRDRLPDELQELGCAVFDNWVENMPPIDGMRELVGDLKAAGIPLYLISNISIGFVDRYPHVPWLRDLLALFDGLVFSGPVHMVKPNREIFEHLLRTFDLQAEDGLFIDDSPLNVAGAKAVGIDGYVFDGDADRLRHYLHEEIGL